jgi:hypothetical protein
MSNVFGDDFALPVPANTVMAYDDEYDEEIEIPLKNIRMVRAIDGEDSFRVIFNTKDELDNGRTINNVKSAVINIDVLLGALGWQDLLVEILAADHLQLTNPMSNE